MDVDNNNDKLDDCDNNDAEGHLKRWCLASPSNHNDFSWKFILDPHFR